MAAQGQAMSQAGMLQALDFQFAPVQLLGADTPLAATATLAPGEALLVPQQFLAYKGPGDTLRVAVTTEGAPTPRVGELPIRHGQAPGEFRFPLQGRWFVGAAASAHGHHRWVVPQEFALDVSRLGEGGRTYRGDGSRMQDYYAYGATVLASADGEVVKAVDGIADNVAMLRAPGEALPAYLDRLRAGQAQLLAGGLDQISGNHLVVRHADGVFSVYAHLQPGSLKVEVGHRVQAGQAIGLLGGSGNSTEPHLHFHLCDGPDPLHCAGLPVAFSNIELPYSEGPRSLQSGDLVDTHP
jgi:murein DD-endopeptidase MepM/ murein hydrolase activator NlpD